jgi:hypothetical protein
MYTLARLGLFLVSFGLVWAVASVWLDWNATNGLGAAVLALLVSALASYVLLRGLRDRTAIEVAGRADRMRDAFARSRRDLDGEPERPALAAGTDPPAGNGSRDPRAGGPVRGDATQPTSPGDDEPHSQRE